MPKSIGTITADARGNFATKKGVKSQLRAVATGLGLTIQSFARNGKTITGITEDGTKFAASREPGSGIFYNGRVKKESVEQDAYDAMKMAELREVCKVMGIKAARSREATIDRIIAYAAEQGAVAAVVEAPTEDEARAEERAAREEGTVAVRARPELEAMSMKELRALAADNGIEWVTAPRRKADLIDGIIDFGLRQKVSDESPVLLTLIDASTDLDGIEF